MHLPPGLIPPALAWAANLVFALLLLAAAWRAPWRHLRNNEDSHVLFGACVALLGVWSIRAGVQPGLELHLLGVTLLTLMFGWQFAFLAVSTVLLAVTANSGSGWLSFGGNALLTGMLPVALSITCLRLSQHHLPDNFFVYIFVAAFFGGAVAMAGVGLASTALWWLAGAHSWSWLMQHYTSFALMLAFPEAFMTGALLAVFVVYRPQWVASFDDERYLKGRMKGR